MFCPVPDGNYTGFEKEGLAFGISESDAEKFYNVHYSIIRMRFNFFG